MSEKYYKVYIHMKDKSITVLHLDENPTIKLMVDYRTTHGKYCNGIIEIENDDETWQILRADISFIRYKQLISGNI